MAIKRFELYRGKPNVVAHPEKNSQSFLAGDLIKISSGQVALWTGTDIGAAGVFGVACKNGVNDTNNSDTPVMVITPTQEWRAFPATSVAPTASFSVGVDYKVAQASAGAGYIGAAGVGCVIAKIKAKNQDGTTAGDPMIIRFSNAGLQGLEG